MPVRGLPFIEYISLSFLSRVTCMIVFCVDNADLDLHLSLTDQLKIECHECVFSVLESSSQICEFEFICHVSVR